jgi:hypothetical protein
MEKFLYKSLSIMTKKLLIYRYVRNILAKFKNKLNELGFERVWLGKKWYWSKRDYKFGEVFTFDE